MFGRHQHKMLDEADQHVVLTERLRLPRFAARSTCDRTLDGSEIDKFSFGTDLLL